MKIDRGVTPTVAMAALVVGLALPAAAGEDHVMLTPDEVDWQPAPPSVPEGAEASVLYGNPGEEGLFALRLRMPDGYAIPPHTHPQPEIVTVLSGTFRLGMGEEADIEATEALPEGSFFALQPGLPHFAFVEGETVIQLNSTGPWQLEYVHDEDDPRS
jgi:quercetin dioxygenase-like cupin family protein